MKIFTAVMVGATMLSGAALATLPAQARGDISVQIGPGGLSIGVDQYRDRCRDYSYRHRYYDNCNRYRFNDDYYVDRGEYYQWEERNHRHHYYNERNNRRHHRHHHDRDRDDRDGNNWH